MCLCQSVCEFKRICSFSLTGASDKKGSPFSISMEILAFCPNMLNAFVCCMNVCAVCVCVCDNCCMCSYHIELVETSCVHMCVLTGFTVRQSILSSPRNPWTGWHLEKRHPTNKMFSLMFLYGITDANVFCIMKARHQNLFCLMGIGLLTK